MEQVLILTKLKNEKARLLGEDIKRWFLSKNILCEVISNEDFISLNELDFRPDLLVVLGGDGTVLSIIHRLNLEEDSIPILGFNLGRVGFLTSADPDKWKDVLERVLSKRFHMYPQMLLEYRVMRDGEDVDKGIVVNDIVVSRHGIARLLEFRLWYDGIEMADIRADGLIVATPLGATAYAWAAGGALIDPELKVFELCPVCQFLSNMRPAILPSNRLLKIEVVSSTDKFILTLDGQKGILLKSQDVVEVREAKEVVYFIQTRPTSYIERLKAKGYI